MSDQAKSAAAWPLGADALSLRSICIYCRICPQARKRELPIAHLVMQRDLLVAARKLRALSMCVLTHENNS